MLEGRSWWRLPSGLWHASIFPENRPGQSEVRANTRAKEGVLRGDGRGCRRGHAVSHNAPTFPCPEGASLSRRKPLSRSRPRASRPDKKTTRHAKHAGSLAPRHPKQALEIHLFKRLKDREPGCSDPLRPRATSAPTDGSRAPSTPPGFERGSAAPRTPPFPPFLSFPLPALAHRARISAPLRPATRRRSPHVRTLPARNPALLDLREP